MAEKKTNRTFQNPFSDAFLPTWQLWKDFRKEEHNFSYKGVISEQMAINRLVEVSEGDEEKAVRIVAQSISRCWMDFYKLKQPSNNGTTSKKQANAGAKPKQTVANNGTDSGSLENDAANVLKERNAKRGQSDYGTNLKAV